MAKQAIGPAPATGLQRRFPLYKFGHKCRLIYYNSPSYARNLWTWVLTGAARRGAAGHALRPVPNREAPRRSFQRQVPILAFPAGSGLTRVRGRKTCPCPSVPRLSAPLLLPSLIDEPVTIG